MTKKELQKLPSKVNILGTVYKFDYVMDRNSIAKKHPGVGEGCDGIIDFDRAEIQIYIGNREFSVVWRTIFHEIIHGIGGTLHLTGLSGFGCGCNSSHNIDIEDTVDRLSTALYDLLSRNNWIKFR